ncbi:MAG: ABC transporter ATP-binding protein [Christensenellales bacterium]|jgi:ABC-type lipoprotein export system ATPase subunit
MMLLQVKDLSKRYTRGERPFLAVDGVNLCMDGGDFVSIIGRSGSGKSTLLNMLTGLVAPTSGSILLEGTDICAMRDREMARLRGTRLGYIPQGACALSNLSVLDNVRLPHYLGRRQGDASSRAIFLLEQVGLAPLASMFPSRLSGGELRRVLIARALINEPDLLIADEPTADLDVETTGEIMALFSRINKSGTAVLIVTHEMDALAFAKRVLRMSRGRLTEATGAAEGFPPGVNPEIPGGISADKKLNEIATEGG